MSVSIADLKLLTELKKSRLLITAGADGEAVRGATEKAQKRVYFLLCFFPLAAYAAPLRGFLYCRIRAKVFGDCQGTFFKKSLDRGQGQSPVYNRCEWQKLRAAPRKYKIPLNNYGIKEKQAFLLLTLIILYSIIIKLLCK